MPDLGTPLPPPNGRPLGEALRALPLVSPPRSAWPALAKGLPPRPASRWQRYLPHSLATAAALALALLLPVPDTLPGTDASGSDAALTAEAGLPRLMAESARLERLIAAAGEDPLQPAETLLLGLTLEDAIAEIDAELAEGPSGPAVDALWRQRVELLAEYAELELVRRRSADAGGPFDTALVSLY